MNTISIIGAGGHTRSILNLIKQHYSCDLEIFDDTYCDTKTEYINNIKLAGKIQDISLDNSLVFLSIGDNTKRAHYFNLFHNTIIMDNLIHKSSLIETSVVLGKANQILAQVYINSNTKIGNNNIINTSAIIEHEVQIGDHNHISVGAKLCGRTKIGNYCMVGTGAIIIDKISICDNVTVGAGAVVVKDITQPGTYVGNPAKKIK
jgi:sugar O-acyltransferase (sialic acid O-acetyltransferase NeuD family)